MRENYWLKKR